MPRYLVERTFPDGLSIPADDSGAKLCLGVVGGNAELGVTWVHLYVSLDKKDPRTASTTAQPRIHPAGGQHNGLPIDRITEVRVLDPYFYR